MYAVKFRPQLDFKYGRQVAILENQLRAITLMAESALFNHKSI
jgi:hypothetical protein